MEMLRCVIAARFAAAPIVFALSLAPASAAPTIQLRVVAVSGQAAPGTPAGTRFALLGPADFDGAPSIGPDSAMAFAATLSDGTAGFWVDHGSGPELLSRSGTPAPGAGPGVLFSQRLSEVIIFTPPSLVPGHAVFRDTIVGPGVDFTNNDCLWTSSSAGLALMARAGQSAPGIAGVRLSAMNLHSVDADGRAVFFTSLAGALVGFNDQSIWRAAPNGDHQLLAREGDAAPGAGFGVVFAAPAGPSAFPIVIGNAVGDVLFQGNLHGPGTAAGNDEALFIRDVSGTRLFIREGDPVPGMPGFFFRFGGTAGFDSSGISLSDTHHVAIASNVSNGTQTTSALLSDSAGTLTRLVRSGDAAPGANGPFDLLVNPIMNSRGDVAFLASTGPGSAHPTLGLWLHSNGGLRAIAIPGQPLPDQPDAALFQNIQAIKGFSGAGFLLFTAELAPPGGPSSTALLLADASGAIGLMARTGSQMVIGSDHRTVSQLIVRRSALSDDAHAAFAVQFVDGSSAEILAAAVAPPSCGSADFNCDGDVGTDADIESFFACLSGACPGAPCSSTADYNQDGDAGADADIESFFRVLAGGHC